MASVQLPAQDTSTPREFVAAFSTNDFSLDPLHSFTAFTSEFYTAIYEGLLVNNPFTLEPTPGIASRWEVSKDGRFYLFSIRPEAVYSDGTPVRAQDFIDSWMRIMDPASKAEYSFLFDPIKGARAYRNGLQKDPKSVGLQAVDPRTLQVELEKPAPYFPKLVCHIAFLPVYPRYLKLPHWGNAKTVIGDGPYIITERTDSELVLSKNNLYWDAAGVGLPVIRLRFVDDSSTATDDFLAGKIDWSSLVDFSKVKSSDNVIVSPMFATSYFYFVCDKAPWSDWRVRRALALLLPWDDLRSKDVFLFPDERLVPQISSYPDVDGITSTNADEAMKLLSDAGFPRGKGLPTLVIKVQGEDSVSTGQARKMADTWKSAIGLPTDVRVFKPDNFYAELKKADFTVGVSTWIGDYADPLTFLQLWTSDSNLNDAHFSDSGFDKDVSDALSIQDTADRYKKLAEAEGILLTKAVVLPIDHTPAVNLIDLNRVDGWYPNPLDLHPFKYFDFKTQKAPPGTVMLPHSVNIF
jgi:peptide/nickel transport system substrate-binding protein/oligopeptide transport system substrate-binding protein